LRAKLVAKSVKTTKLLDLVLSKFKTFVSQGKSKKVQIFLKGSYRMLLTIMSFYWAIFDHQVENLKLKVHLR